MRYTRSTDKQLKTLSDWPTMLLTFAVCLLCWILCYADPVSFPIAEEEAPGGGGEGSLWAFVVSPVRNSRLSACLAGLFLLLFVSYVMQRISDIEMLTGERTRLPFMLYLLLVSTNAGLLPIREVFPALLCLVFAVYGLFCAYRSPESKGDIFNTGVLIGLAGLFLPPVCWLLPLFWSGMYRLRILDTRTFMASLLGMITVFWFVLAWCVWKHDFLIFSFLYDGWTDFKWLPSGLFYPVELVLILIVFTMTYLHIKADVYKNSLRVRRILSFLLTMTVWIVALILLYGEDTDSYLAILYLPLSVITARFLENTRRVYRFIMYYSILLACLTSFVLRIWIF
jgi:hypothetical protein